MRGGQSASGGRDSQAKEAGGGKKRKRRPQKTGRERNGFLFFPWRKAVRGVGGGSPGIRRQGQGDIRGRGDFRREPHRPDGRRDLAERCGGIFGRGCFRRRPQAASQGRRVLLDDGAACARGREEPFERLQFDPSLLTMSDFLLMERREQRLAEILGPED